MQETQKCFVIGCKHEVREEIHDHPFCFIHSELAKNIINMNKEFFFTQEKNGQLNLVLPQNDQNFVLSHLDGCNATELSQQVGISINAITTKILNNKISAQKQKGKRTYYWCLIPSVIIRVLDSYRNWITVNSVAKQINVPSGTLFMYAEQGKLGPIKFNVNGKLCINIKFAAETSKIKSIVRKNQKKGMRNKKIKSGETIRQGQICAIDLANFLGLRLISILRWIEHGWLNTRRNKRTFIITPEDIFDLQRTIRNKKTKIKSINQERILALSRSEIYKLFPKKS